MSAHRPFMSLTVAVAAVAAVLVGPATPAQAATAPGKACAKVGAKVTVGWTQLVCRRSGAAKKWRVLASGPVYSAKEVGGLVDCAADPTAALLDATRARVYYATSGEGPCRASEDTAPDSLVVPLVGGSAELDAGKRFTPFNGPAGPHKRVFKLPDGGYRMYYSTAIGRTPVGIGSSTSANGIDFVEDPGLRISLADAGVGVRPALSPGDIVPTKDGRFRMYFSSFAFGPRDPVNDTEIVKSAVSSDLLNWTVEPGVRIGKGARLTGSGEHPAAVRQPDGSVTLFYGRPFNEHGLYYSWSPDGLTFTKELLLFRFVLDSSFIRMDDGRLSGFVGRRDNGAERSYIDRVILTPRR